MQPAQHTVCRAIGTHTSSDAVMDSQQQQPEVHTVTPAGAVLTLLGAMQEAAEHLLATEEELPAGEEDSTPNPAAPPPPPHTPLAVELPHEHRLVGAAGAGRVGRRLLAPELSHEPADISGAVPVAQSRTQAPGHRHAASPQRGETGRHRCLEAGHSRQLPIHGPAVWRRQGHHWGCPHGGRPRHQCPAPPQAREAGGPGCRHRGLCHLGLPQLLQGSGWDPHPHARPGTEWRTLHKQEGLPLSGPPGLGGQLVPFPGHLCRLAWQHPRRLGILELGPMPPAGGGDLHPPAEDPCGGHHHAPLRHRRCGIPPPALTHAPIHRPSVCQPGALQLAPQTRAPGSGAHIWPPPRALEVSPHPL
ncbi:uncharacterized protein LOC142007391 [Carettochelys insculpta]|uniref:uncharacterized protein LOC142007391 n=1 Tax=Carettochelys insculpta TaxID=44489 RepID=UPI003EB98C3E